MKFIQEGWQATNVLINTNLINIYLKLTHFPLWVWVGLGVRVGLRWRLVGRRLVGCGGVVKKYPINLT